MSAGNTAGSTGKTAMMINKTNIATTIVDKPATSKADYEKTYYRYRALFNACGDHVDFVRVG
jgi:hypothetical protein